MDFCILLGVQVLQHPKPKHQVLYKSGGGHVTVVIVIVLVAESCPTLCDSMDYSPPGSSVRGISQARTLDWVAISFSRGLMLQRSFIN